jgi:hypothetical protein
MKQPERLTREQKILCKANYLNPNDWMFVEEGYSTIKIINKATGKIKRIDKYMQKRVGDRCILKEEQISM